MNEQTLIERCCQDDRHAQKLLYDQYAGLLYPIALRYSRNEMAAQDALIEAFFKIFTQIKQFRGESSLWTWMRRIVVNTALKQDRKQIYRTEWLELEEADYTERAQESTTTLYYEDIWQFIEQLPEGARTVFCLYEIDGYKHEEIADILQISVNTSRVQLSKAKQKLKQMLKAAGYVSQS